MSEKDDQGFSELILRSALLGYWPTTFHRGRGAQIVDRLRMLSRQPGIAHTAMARLLQDDARELEIILKEFVT